MLCIVPVYWVFPCFCSHLREGANCSILYSLCSDYSIGYRQVHYSAHAGNIPDCSTLCVRESVLVNLVKSGNNNQSPSQLFFCFTRQGAREAETSNVTSYRRRILYYFVRSQAYRLESEWTNLPDPKYCSSVEN